MNLQPAAYLEPPRGMWPGVHGCRHVQLLVCWSVWHSLSLLQAESECKGCGALRGCPIVLGLCCSWWGTCMEGLHLKWRHNFLQQGVKQPRRVRLALNCVCGGTASLCRQAASGVVLRSGHMIPCAASHLMLPAGTAWQCGQTVVQEAAWGGCGF
jgi:hypothetical protein